MEKLDRANLWSLEEYAEKRDDFRAAVMAHKKPRRVSLGAHATLMAAILPFPADGRVTLHTAPPREQPRVMATSSGRAGR